MASKAFMFSIFPVSILLGLTDGRVGSSPVNVFGFEAGKERTHAQLRAWVCQYGLL